jgi:glutamate/tyrosine decarboxylase-like PLP-dependent enzyme
MYDINVFLGGAISNLYAVLAARHAVLPAIKRQGLKEMPRLVMFESDQVRKC